MENLDILPARGLQVIFGRNETGKTLTVDAIILLLSGLRIREIDRIGELPDGEIVIENSGKVIAISRKTRNPTDYLNVGDPYDLRNLYIIRDSDLRIDNEANLMRRLVGIESERINRVRENLLKLGRLSDKRLDLSDKYDRIKDRYDSAKALVDEIEKYIKEAIRNGAPLLEIKAARLSGEMERIDSRISLLEKAKKAEDYERLKKALSEYLNGHSRYQELEVFNTGQLDLLTRYQTTIDKREEDLEMKRTDVAKKEARQKELLEKKERLLAELPEKDVEADLIRIREDLERLPLPLPAGLLKRIPFVFVPLLAIFVLFYLLVGINIITIIFGASGFGMIGFFLYNILRTGAIENRRRRLIAEAKRLGPIIGERESQDSDKEPPSVEEDGEEGDGDDQKKDNQESIIPAIEEFSDEVKKKLGSLNRIEVELKMLVEELGEDRVAIHRLQKEITNTRERLNSEFLKLGLDRLEDFHARMDELKKVEKRLAESRQSLVDYFKSDDLKLWEEGVEELRQELTDIDESYDLRELDRLKEAKRVNIAELAKIKKLLDDHRARLVEFERRAGKLGVFTEADPDLSVETLDGLKRLLLVLNDFIGDIDRTTEAGRAAIKILDKVSKEDESKLTDILSNRFNASKIFAEVTSGRYKKIRYNPERKDYTVIQDDGSEKNLRMLSKGTFDQLYLSIRVALAEGISKGPRFMIMDDAFLTSDRDRLENQFEVLKKLVDRGWQVIYFTVKEEVVEISSKYTDAKLIKLSPQRSP